MKQSESLNLDVDVAGVKNNSVMKPKQGAESKLQTETDPQKPTRSKKLKTDVEFINVNSKVRLVI